MYNSHGHCESTLQSTTPWQHRRNRPQWCQHWVVFKWAFWLTKFNIRTITNFIISWTFLNFITNSWNCTPMLITLTTITPNHHDLSVSMLQSSLTTTKVHVARYSLASLFIMDGRFLRFWTIFGVLCNLRIQERCPGRRLQSEEPSPRSRKLTVKLGQNVHIFDKDVKIYTFK